MHEFAEWDSFYLIIGGAAGALIGLQFVVMTLIANSSGSSPARAGVSAASADEVVGGRADAGRAFSTPTVVHFTAVLFMAALMRIPWQSITPAAVIGGLVGLAGAVYVIRVHLIIRRQDSYKPVFEDWLFHCILPIVAYLGFAVLGLITLISGGSIRFGFYGAAAAVFILLFTGIHNAWDAVTYHIFEKPAEQKKKRKP